MRRTGVPISDADVLARLATGVGLDEARTREILTTDAFAAEVREREQFYQARGITVVPAVILNDKYLISGGQPVEVFEKALRQAVNEAGATAG